MNNSIFQEIDRFHSEWSSMEKQARLGWLMGAKMRLNGMANQFAHYVSLRGGIMSDAEKAYAQKRLEMIKEIDVNGTKAVKDLANDTLKETVRRLMNN